MPQKSKPFDPNEFATPEVNVTLSSQMFDPNEFATQSPHKIPSTPPPAGEQPNPYKPFWDSVSSYIPEPVKSGWNKIWSPMTDLPSRAAHAVAEPMMQWGESHPDIPYGQAARYGGAYLQSLGDIGTQMTSPGNVALIAATAGTGLAEKAGLEQVANALSGASRVAGGTTAVHGGLQALNPDATLPERGMGALEAIGGSFAARGRTPKILLQEEPTIELPPIKPASNVELQSQISQPAAKPNVLNQAPREYRDMIDKMPDDAIADHITRQEKNPNWNTEVGQNSLNYARSVLAERQSNPSVPIKTELPQQPPATNITPENQADMETWFKLKKLYDSGKMTENQMQQWAEVHNRVKDLKPDGAVTLRPYRFESLPPEEPKFTTYSLPDGTHVQLDTSATKGAETTSFQLKGGEIVEARKVPQQEFDPSTLQFVDKTTGEIKSAAEAKPGDVPLVPESNVGESNPPPATLPSKIPGRERMILSDKETTGEVPPPKIAAGLPTNLQGAKPRFNIGYNSYEPVFADDLDKALYIIAQQKPSRMDSSYLKYVMDQTGLDEAGAREMGQQVKRQIKQQAQSQEAGVIKIQPIGRHIKPPKTPEEAIQSLNQRLDAATGGGGKGTEPPGSNVATGGSGDPPKDIKGLIDDAETVLKNTDETKKPGIIRQVLGANKALLTGWDLSAPGRQGKALILNKAWWTSLDDMFKAWGSKEGANLVNQSIEEHPSGYFKHGVSETGKQTPSFAEKAGLDLTPHEEMFNSPMVEKFEKYSLVGKSSRSHTAFLNKLRSDQFASMMNDSKAAGFDPESNLNIAKAYAKFINDATGRGSVNFGKWKLERIMPVMNDVFFAPKNMSGQIRTWNNVLNPVKYYNYDPVLRMQALKSLFAVAGMGLGVGELSRLMGAKVSNDPNSSDFRKIKIGDTRIDPFGGYQQFPVAAMKLISGKSTSSISGKTVDLTGNRFGQRNRKDVAETFFTNRLSPLGSFIYGWMNNKEFDGKPFTVKRALFERVFPIAAKDIVDLAQTDPALAAVTAIPTMFGLTGTQHYTGR